MQLRLHTFTEPFSKLNLMKTFRLYWLDGKTEIVEGETIAKAFSNAGYGGGAIRALDYYKEVKIQ